MSATLRHRLGWGVLACCGALAAMLPAMDHAMASIVLTATLLVAPGALLASVLPGPGFVVGRWGMALVLGVFAIGAPFTLLRLLEVPAPIAARSLAGIVGLLALVRARSVGPAMEPSDPREWWPAAAWAVVVAGLLILNPALAPRADGWFHAGVTLQLLERLPPPEDPYFAGLRLLYFWGMHVWGSMWLVLSPGLSVWTPWIVANVAASAAILLAVAAAARALGATPRTSGLAAVLTVVAWSPFGWLQLASRAAVGEVRGWPEVTRLVSAGVDPLMDLLARGQLHASMAFHGDKSLVLTPFGPGLALFVLAITAAIEMQRSPRQAIAFGVLLAAALFTHTVAGNVLVLLAGLWCALSVPALLRGESGARSRVLGLGAAVGAAVLLTAPYVLAVTTGKQGQLALGFSAAAFQTMGLGTGAVLIAAALWYRHDRPGRRVLLGSAAALTFGGLFVDLPESNQSKFFNFLMLALVPPAMMQLDAWASGSARRAKLRWAVLAVVFLPTPSLCLWAHCAEHGQSRLSWHEPSSEVAALFDWARMATTPETMFADLGGAREVLTLSGRSVLWGGRDGERDWGHPPALLEVRRRAVRALCTGADVGAEELALLRALGRPIVVIAREGLPATATARQLAERQASGYRLLREAGGVALLTWDGAR